MFLGLPLSKLVFVLIENPKWPPLQEQFLIYNNIKKKPAYGNF
jgi:hypothetical protein